jgi:RNA polymerase sigma-70 factor (ECF subfamily)
VAADLERAALEGDRSAWSELIATHERRVVLSLIGSGVMPAQAREYAHDAWLRLMQQAAAGRLEYLQLPGLVVRQALFLARSGARRATPEPEAPLVTDEAPAEASFFAHERLARARAHVESLAPSARAVFLSLYREPQLSHAEVAAQVGLSVQRVRQIICEVRKSLRTELDEEKTDVPPRKP